jgi:hypothetical protein
MMLTKDQALAAMDAHIIGVRARRAGHLYKRWRRMSFLYPALRQVPYEAREALCEAAVKRALCTWTTYLGLVLYAHIRHFLSRGIRGRM